MTGGRNEANRTIVRQVRNEIRPELFGPLEASGVRVYVAGQPASTLDIVGIYDGATPRIFLFVLGLSFLLMLIAFRSIVIPIKAILLNLLSTAAAFGVMVLVFQEGLVRGAARHRRVGGVIEAGSRSSRRSCSGCRWTTTSSSSADQGGAGSGMDSRGGGSASP